MELLEHSMPDWHLLERSMLRFGYHYTLSDDYHSCAYMWFFEIQMHQYWTWLGCKVERLEHSMHNWDMH
jgi:hypothetical protein